MYTNNVVGTTRLTETRILRSTDDKSGRKNKRRAIKDEKRLNSIVP